MPANTITDLSTELSRLVRSWRLRLNPADFPDIARPGIRYTHRRRKTRMTQEDIAKLIGVSSVWYGNLERGDRSQNYSPNFLDRTAYVLRLNPDERTALYLYATGSEPDTHEEETIQVTSELRRLVDDQPYPAYLRNESWDVIAYNDEFRKWFPWVSHERNVMRWVFTYQDARQQLVRWNQEWAPLMLAQMRLANAKNPDNARVAAVIEEILAHNNDARQLWEREPKVYAHPDGDRRQVRLARDRVLSVEIVVLSLMRTPSVCLVSLVPIK